MSAQFIRVEVNEFSNKNIDKYDQELRAVRRLLIPTVAAVSGSDLVCNYVTLHLVIHMKIQSKNPARLEWEASLVFKKKEICLLRQCWGWVPYRDTECITPWANGKMNGEGTHLVNLKWEGKWACDNVRVKAGKSRKCYVKQSTKGRGVTVLHGVLWGRASSSGLPASAFSDGDRKGPWLHYPNSKKALFRVGEG